MSPPTMRAPAPDGGWVWIHRPGARAHRCGVWGLRGLSSTGIGSTRLPPRGERDEPREPPGHRRLRDRRLGAGRELPEGERRMAEPERRGLLQRRGERVERAALGQRARGVELKRRRAALPDEVRVVGVGEAVRSARRPATSARSSSVSTIAVAPGHGQVALDRLPALRVCGRVRLPVDHPHAHPGGRRDAADEGGARVERRPHLEVRRPRPAERACAEEGPAEIRRAAARARDHPAGRPVERQPLGAEDARFPQDVDRVARSRRRAAVSGTPVRTRAAGRCGSATRPAAAGGSRTPAARRPTPPGRGGTRALPGRGGGRCRPCGRAPRARQGGRTGAPG